MSTTLSPSNTQPQVPGNAVTNGVPSANPNPNQNVVTAVTVTPNANPVNPNDGANDVGMGIGAWLVARN